ncbi:XRE family transcriptional regulator [Amycolatopsis sp. SID8362]|uniref:helix-turn-helix domain-containing protein n=1 Tax=Amycolatopsis sp. SID8362 TaxID=2690346 RepID=UPI001371EB7A|nr:XRE family transcriptional regulator [Amycolatopsis sp. SID8362]NBH06017.1 ImmA/IrrE family metallo-endopeptidase [Amycolatopsis sp. SID8362]NED42715.1 ImmA/IrrE family metallo-endopeptidase [Amycolatopsis sp. SID8362]
MTDTTAAARMVRLVREARSWAQHDLANAAGISQGFVSKVEKGLLPLTGDYLDKVAAALAVPPDLLRTSEPVGGVEVTCLHHRRRSSVMSVTTMRAVEGLTHLTRLSVDRLSTDVDRLLPRRELIRMPVEEHGSPATIAGTLRKFWDVPDGPVHDVVGLFESAGVRVMRRDLGTTAQDAVSTWPAGRQPLILINRGLPPDRERFTLAHEVGHLIMHEMPSDEQEKEANQFAGEFLAPATDLEPLLAGLTVRQFPKLAELKLTWKVSMAMLIQRAADLDCISANQFKSFRIRLNQYGWSKREPGDLPAESPRHIAGLVKTQLDRHGHDVDAVAGIALMLPEPFRRHYLPLVVDDSGPAAVRS